MLAFFAVLGCFQAFLVAFTVFVWGFLLSIVYRSNGWFSVSVFLFVDFRAFSVVVRGFSRLHSDCVSNGAFSLFFFMFFGWLWCFKLFDSEFSFGFSRLLLDCLQNGAFVPGSLIVFFALLAFFRVAFSVFNYLIVYRMVTFPGLVALFAGVFTAFFGVLSFLVAFQCLFETFSRILSDRLQNGGFFLVLLVFFAFVCRFQLFGSLFSICFSRLLSDCLRIVYKMVLFWDGHQAPPVTGCLGCSQFGS